MFDQEEILKQDIVMTAYRWAGNLYNWCAGYFIWYLGGVSCGKRFLQKGRGDFGQHHRGETHMGGRIFGEKGAVRPWRTNLPSRWCSCWYDSLIQLTSNFPFKSFHDPYAILSSIPLSHFQRRIYNPAKHLKWSILRKHKRDRTLWTESLPHINPVWLWRQVFL